MSPDFRDLNGLKGVKQVCNDPGGVVFLNP